MEVVNHEPLNLLLQASSKDVVVRLCNEAFVYRHAVALPQTVIKNVSSVLTIKESQASQLLLSLSGLIKNALFQDSTQPGDIVKLFPSDFHKNLRDLLGRILLENLPSWRSHAVNNLVSLPRLVDFDWRVDIKSSSDAITRMSVPTCILQLKVQDTPSKAEHLPDMSCLNVELSKETLDTMLDGLGKIRDQLSSVAKKS